MADASLSQLSSTMPADEKQRRPRLWPVFVVFLLAMVVAVVVQALASIALALWLIARGTPPANVPQQLVSLLSWPPVFIFFGLGGQAVMLAAPLLAGWLSPEPLGRRLAVNRTRLSIWRHSLIALASWAPAAVGLGLAHALSLLVEPDLTAEQLFSQMTWGVLPFYLIFITLFPSFSEELLFRGYVQRRLAQRWGPVAAILTSTTLFALAHVTPHAVVFAWPLGVWFGYVAWRCGSVVPTIVCHAFINGSWTVGQVGSRLLEVPPQIRLALGLGVLVLSVLAFAASLRLLCLPAECGVCDRAAALDA